MADRNTSKQCSKANVFVPNELPKILKNFTDDAIKAQPLDVLAWSAAYFRALATGEPRTSYSKHTEITPSILRILHKQMSPLKTVTISQLKSRWMGLALLSNQLERILKKGEFSDLENLKWMEFLAYTCYSIAENLTDAMRIACLCVTLNESGSIPFPIFVQIYKYLGIHKGFAKDPQLVNDRICCLERIYVKEQDGYIKPENFKKGNFPSLDGV